MRFYLLLVAFVASTLPAYACLGGGGDDDPPPRVVRITGERAACTGTRFVYQVEVENTDQLTLSVVGGTISPVSAPLTNICGGVPAPVQSNASTLVYTPNSGNCSFAISAVIQWNSSGTRRLTATAREGSTSRSSTVTFTGREPSISGPGSPLCVNDFGSGSFFFSSSGPPGASRQWSTSGSSPLTIASPTSASTSISGFQPGSFYTVRVTYTCPGQAPVSRSLSVQTLSFNDPSCNPFNCPPGEIDCLEPRDAPSPDVSAPPLTVDDVPTDGAETGTGHTLPGVQPLTGLSGRVTATDQSVAVYPNPIRRGDELTVRLPDSESAGASTTLVRLVDFSGRVLFQTESSTTQVNIPMTEVAAGGYLLQTVRGEQITATKLIVRPQRP